MLWLQDGGPGESGVAFTLQNGDIIQTIINSDLDPSDNAIYDAGSLPKYFDILGVDPRSINNSIPHISYFPNAASRENWWIESHAEGTLGSSSDSFPNMWARMEALGKGCSHRIASSKDPGDQSAHHVNTSVQLADIVAILEAYGEWREKSVRQLLEGHTDEVSLRTIERTRWEKDQERLLFWGFSYGSVIGTTFAAMQPHRVERLVVDGVADAGDFYRGERLRNIQDADAILEKSMEHCYQAGPEKCALYAEGGSEKMTERFYEILESLKGKPVNVPGSSTLPPEIITYSSVKSALKTTVYAPLQKWMAEFFEFGELEKIMRGLGQGGAVLQWQIILTNLEDGKEDGLDWCEVRVLARPDVMEYPSNGEMKVDVYTGNGVTMIDTHKDEVTGISNDSGANARMEQKREGGLYGMNRHDCSNINGSNAANKESAKIIADSIEASKDDAEGVKTNEARYTKFREEILKELRAAFKLTELNEHLLKVVLVTDVQGFERSGTSKKVVKFLDKRR